MERKKWTFDGGDGVGERKNLSSAPQLPGPFLSSHNSSPLSGEEKEGERFSRIPDLFARKRVYLGRRHLSSVRRLSGEDPELFPFWSLFLSLRGKREERDQRDLGTTLGRACSRWCRERRVRSKIGWLAGSRDSHHVSRFAAFFILARAEISVDGSCFGVSRFSLFFW